MVNTAHSVMTGLEVHVPFHYVQLTDPGAVGANLFWLDTTTNAIKRRNVGNTAWDAIGTGATGPTGATGGLGPQGPNGIAGSVTVSGSPPYICVQDQKGSGIGGGTFVSGSYLTRTLNTITVNDLNLAVLNAATSQITLPAGTWRTTIHVAAFAIGLHKIRLQNITAGAPLLIGLSAVSANTDNSGSDAFLKGRFELRSPSVLEVQHRGSVTFADTRARGDPSSFGDIEVYAVAEFWLVGGPPPFFGLANPNPPLGTLAARAATAVLYRNLSSPLTLGVPG